MSNLISRILSKISLYLFRCRNKNHNFTLLSRDCIGGCLYNQLGLKFLTPTINLFFSPSDFVELCLHLKEYANGELIECPNSDKQYPVGLLYPSPSSTAPIITINFMHYKTFEEAKSKWEDRFQRIVWDNIYVISTFCYTSLNVYYCKSLVNGWNKIPYKKVIIVDKHYGFDDEFIITRPKKSADYIYLFERDSKVLDWKKIFNRFDLINFLKTNKK